MVEWYLGICGFSSLIIGFYLFYRWKTIISHQRTPTMFFWALGFTLYGLVYAAGLFTAQYMTPREIQNQGLINIIAYGIPVLGLILIYRGTIRFFTKNYFWKNIIPLFFIVILIFLGIYGFSQIYQDDLFFSIYSFFVVAPLYLILGVLFLSFYRYFNSLVKQFNGQTVGFLLVSFSWFLLLIGSLILPWISEIYPLNNWSIELPKVAQYWFISRIFAHILFLVGFVFVGREMHKLIELSGQNTSSKSSPAL